MREHSLIEKSRSPVQADKESALMPLDKKNSRDKWMSPFLEHLETERGASPYTRRNYGQTLKEFAAWHRREQNQPLRWKTLQRHHFRAWLRHLSRNKLSRAAIQLRFSALRSFYRYLVKKGETGRNPRQTNLPAQSQQAPAPIPRHQSDDQTVASAPDGNAEPNPKRIPRPLSPRRRHPRNHVLLRPSESANSAASSSKTSNQTPHSSASSAKEKKSDTCPSAPPP